MEREKDSRRENVSKAKSKFIEIMEEVFFGQNKRERSLNFSSSFFNRVEKDNQEGYPFCIPNKIL